MDMVLARVRTPVQSDERVVAVLLLDCRFKAVKQLVDCMDLFSSQRAEFRNMPRRQHHKMAVVQRLDVGDAEAVLIFIDEPIVFLLCSAEGAAVVHGCFCSRRE